MCKKSLARWLTVLSLAAPVVASADPPADGASEAFGWFGSLARQLLARRSTTASCCGFPT
jgi:hypothetical protein